MSPISTLRRRKSAKPASRCGSPMLRWNSIAVRCSFCRGEPSSSVAIRPSWLCGFLPACGMRPVVRRIAERGGGLIVGAHAARTRVADPMSASEKRPTLPERPGWARRASVAIYPIRVMCCRRGQLIDHRKHLQQRTLLRSAVTLRPVPKSSAMAGLGKHRSASIALAQLTEIQCLLDRWIS
jgi:hypothetical protein